MSLINNKEIAYLSLNLVKPFLVDIKIFLEKISKNNWHDSNFKNAINFFDKLELKSILKKIIDILFYIIYNIIKLLSKEYNIYTYIYLFI